MQICNNNIMTKVTMIDPDGGWKYGFPKMLPNELEGKDVTEWLIENGFQGLDGQEMPNMPDSFVQTISERYIELYEKITGKKFIKSDTTNIIGRIEENVGKYLTQKN